MNQRIREWPHDEIRAWCERWRVKELSVFGSVLRDDFRPDSDVDLLVSFDSDARWSLLDLVTMKEELVPILGREVDLVSRRGLERSENWIRKNAILGSLERVYLSQVEPLIPPKP